MRIVRPKFLPDAKMVRTTLPCEGFRRSPLREQEPSEAALRTKETRETLQKDTPEEEVPSGGFPSLARFSPIAKPAVVCRAS